MKKMKVFFTILAILALFILTATPALASPPPLPWPWDPPMSAPNVNGIELFAGVDFANINWGATFTAKAQVAYKGHTYDCNLTAAVDYTPDHPEAGVTNQIVGGTFTLTAPPTRTSPGGVIRGRLNQDGSITWYSGTDYGLVAIPSLKIMSASGVFGEVKGGRFEGFDNHVDGPIILGIRVPTITGYLEIN